MPDRHLYLQTATTSQYVAQIIEHQLAPVGIPASLLALLTHVRDLDPVSPSALSRAAGTPATTLRDNIQRLVDRKLVRRVANPADGRSYLVRITPRGIRTLGRADPVLLEAYLALEDRLPRPRAEYERMLAELNEALGHALDALAGAADTPESAVG